MTHTRTRSGLRFPSLPANDCRRSRAARTSFPDRQLSCDQCNTITRQLTRHARAASGVGDPRLWGAGDDAQKAAVEDVADK
jgi:hypothetical protein